MAEPALPEAVPSPSSSYAMTTIKPVKNGSLVVSTTTSNYLPRFKARVEERERKKQQEHHSRKGMPVPPPRLTDTSTIDSKLSAFGESAGNAVSRTIPNTREGVLLPISPTSSSAEAVAPLPVTVPIVTPDPTTPPKIVKINQVNSKKSDDAKSEEVTDFFDSLVRTVKTKLGFTPDCLNGGTKRSSGVCVCRTYFSGEQCQKRECINNGTLTQIRKNPVEEVCRCPHPEYVAGPHCETVHCMNGGRFVNGSCLCVDNWYSGQFCQNYSASWFAVLGIPLICIAVIAFCCVVCRLDFCPRRNSTSSSRSRSRHRNRAHGESRSRNHHNSRRPPRNGPERPHYHHPYYDVDATGRENALHSSPQIAGLANYPEYNPALPPPASPDNFKPNEPPPSYEQAVASCSTVIPTVPAMPYLSSQSSIPPPPTYSPPRPTLANQSSFSSLSDSSRSRAR